MNSKHCVFLMAAMFVLMAVVVPLSASVTDDRIVSSAQDSYVWKTYLKGDDIKIASRNGAVTLTGVVAEGFHRSLASETVESLPGVNSVDNKLTVKGEGEGLAASPDSLMLGKVKATLLFHRSTSACKTDVSVKDGKVTLRGDAASLAQKDLATEYAMDVYGVKDVDNQMTVSSVKTTTEKVTDFAKSTTGNVSDFAKTTTGNVSGYIDDASISAQVKYALLVHRSTGAIKTKVDTENGVVTLSGSAKNQAERTLVTKLVNDINGVKGVNNKMAIE